MLPGIISVPKRFEKVIYRSVMDFILVELRVDAG